MLESVLAAFGINTQETSCEKIGHGLINHTWKLTTPAHIYLLQKINDSVFKNPMAIAENIDHIGRYLNIHEPAYLFTTPIKTITEHRSLFYDSTGYYRLFNFVEGSQTIQTVANPVQAYEAAAQFGRFTYLLSGFDARLLHITLPNFHNLPMRYNQFQHALQHGSQERIRKATWEIETIKRHVSIVKSYQQLVQHPSCKTRVTHHDTKISNVLFDAAGRGLCVIDLDTVMPGHFISDVGDMMRTYLCSASEEEADFDSIQVRQDCYDAIVQGYSDEMKDQLTDTERSSFFFSGVFAIYMQALRFLTDYLNDDIYYTIAYPSHNQVRAGNQLTLLQQYLALTP